MEFSQGVRGEKMFKRVKTKIEYATTEAYTDENGNILWYRITPNEGYKLHEITLDEVENETSEPKLGFTTSYVTAGVNYDFEKNVREIYAVKEE